MPNGKDILMTLIELLEAQEHIKLEVKIYEKSRTQNDNGNSVNDSYR